MLELGLKKIKHTVFISVIVVKLVRHKTGQPAVRLVKVGPGKFLYLSKNFVIRFKT